MKLSIEEIQKLIDNLSPVNLKTFEKQMNIWYRNKLIEVFSKNLMSL